MKFGVQMFPTDYAILAVLLAASGAGDTPQASPASATTTPTPVAAATTTATPVITAAPGALTWPDAKRTGDPEVDAVIDAVVAGWRVGS